MSDAPAAHAVEDHENGVTCPCLPVVMRCGCGERLGLAHDLDKAKASRAEGGHP